MMQFFEDTLFWGCALSLAAYFLGTFLRNKIKKAWMNPLLFAIAAVVAILALTKIPYAAFKASCAPLSYLLTPATVCLAIPLYRQIRYLKAYPKAILAGITTGVITSLAGVLVIALIFSLNHAQYVTLLPKSITTAIGMGLSEEMGGLVTVTVAIIILTGLMGNLTASFVLKLFRIEDSVAKGVAIGTSSHAIGTAKAMELGEVEGAISGLSLAIAGLLTVIGMALMGNLI